VKSRTSAASFIAVLLLPVVGLMFVGLAEANPGLAFPTLKVYIRSDGSVDPSRVPIQRVGSVYTFTGDFTNSTIVVERDNIVIDGAGYKLQGNGVYSNTGIILKNRNNVLIKNIDIQEYLKSISLTGCSNIIIYHNNMVNSYNIMLDSSVGNHIVGNNIVVKEPGYGYGITFGKGAASNLIIGNNFSDAGVAVHINYYENNTYYHNNFFNNSRNVNGWIDKGEVNCWNNGEEGNYWSDYNGTDADGDGIGDTPYNIKNCPPDRYPLMSPFDIDSVTVELPEWMYPPSLHVISPENTSFTSAYVSLNFNVNVPTSWMGYSLDGQENVTVTGNTTLTGLESGSHSVTVYAEPAFENTRATSKTVTFTVDADSAVVTVLCPENTFYVSTETAVDVSLNFTVNEPVSRIAYSLDGQANVTVVGNTTLVGLVHGVHNVTVYAWDVVGNVGASEIVVFSVAEPEVFPVVPVAAASAASVTMMGVGLLVYFKKRKH
jgi:hypothetical protein